MNIFRVLLKHILILYLNFVFREYVQYGYILLNFKFLDLLHILEKQTLRSV